MTIAAGQKLRASDLNDVTPLFVRCTNTTSVTSSTTLVVATGMSAELEANTEYALDGYLAYNAGTTGDFKAAMTVPSGTAGHWGMFGVSTSSTANGEGPLNGIRMSAFGTSNTIALGGSTSGSAAVPCGYIATGSSSGALTFMFAQNTSNAASTQVVSGSWLRLWKIV